MAGWCALDLLSLRSERLGGKQVIVGMRLVIHTMCRGHDSTQLGANRACGTGQTYRHTHTHAHTYTHALAHMCMYAHTQTPLTTTSSSSHMPTYPAILMWLHTFFGWVARAASTCQGPTIQTGLLGYGSDYGIGPTPDFNSPVKFAEWLGMKQIR